MRVENHFHVLQTATRAASRLPHVAARDGNSLLHLSIQSAQTALLHDVLTVRLACALQHFFRIREAFRRFSAVLNEVPALVLFHGVIFNSLVCAVCDWAHRPGQRDGQRPRAATS